MNCQEFRAIVGAEPQRSNAGIEAHATSCSACTAYRNELRRMDDVLRRALAVEVDAGALRMPAAPARSAWQGWAMAAGVACATLAAGLLWFASPRSALAADVVAHMAEEPQSWARTEVAADPSRLAQVLARAGVYLKAGAGPATYANSCWFRGHHVPHLVFQAQGGPVTVMVLTEEQVTGPVRFDEGGYAGVIVPAQRGALAILTRGTRPGPDTVSRLQAAIAYASR